MVVLDLGCGLNKKSNATGVDCRPLPGVDVVHDLNQFPYPFPDDYADEVHLTHVLEHLVNPVAALQEVWRICRPGAHVHIRVPHYTGPFAWNDLTHLRCFSSSSFDYFGGNDYSYYTHARYRVRSLRLKYFREPSYRWLYNVWGSIVQSLLDRHRTFSERFFAYIVGGIDEIVVTLEAVKTDTHADTRDAIVSPSNCSGELPL